MSTQIKKNFVNKMVLLVLGAAWCAAGCGDEDPAKTDPKDTSSNNGDSDSPSGLHCPGTMDENNDVWYCVVPAGTYTEDSVASPEALEWNTDVTYILDGKVFIGDGSTETVLTILPGAVILGNPVTDLDNTASLIIQQYSKIEAEGTKESPIIFSSANPVGRRANDDWGGIVINGRAPINICDAQPCEAAGEGETGTFGGDDKDDNSGTLAYVRIEFSGKRLTATVEFNGLTLQGVGRGTEIHHVQIHRAGDDSIEFFGGTAEVRNLLISGSGDDFFDWTHGWSGKAQFVAAQGAKKLAYDMGIEADNFANNFDAEPRSNPTLMNFTLDGTVLLRAGTAGNLSNMVFTTLDIDEESTWNQVDNGALTVTHSMVTSFTNDPNELFVRDESDQWPLWEGNRISDGDLMLTQTDLAAGIFGRMPEDGSPLLSGAGAPPAGDDFFEAVSYIGAFGDEDWTAGWTAYPEN